MSAPNVPAPILPGATLGVLGGGQLGRMFTIAARRLGYRVHVFAPDDDTPTGQVADREVRAAYDDLDAVAEFARAVDVVTFEFENVPAATTEAAARHAPVRPDGRVLHVTQNRLREKGTLAGAGFPVTPHRPVRTLDELHRAIDELGTPAVLKTASWGYDGKGQRIVDEGSSRQAAERAWDELGRAEAVLEAFVDFEREISVVAARGLDGSFVHYGPFENDHVDHILDVTVSPAPVDARVAADAAELARSVLEALDIVGVLCVEMFVEPGGGLLINELAPRPHNSGHLTVDACVSCQFEQQVRAVCGLPLGDASQPRPAAMANLLGDLWHAADGARRQPDWARCLAVPEVKLHLYGKSEPRPGRKMGHLTAVADTADEARRLVLEARRRLRPTPAA